MPSHHCRIDQVVRQQLDPATTTRGGFGHRCRADGLRVLDLRGANDHLQSGFWQRGSLLCSSCHGGLSGGHLHRLGGYFGSLLSLWCQLLHGHRRWDIAPFGLSACQREDKCISHMRLRLLFGGYYNLSRVLTFNYIQSPNMRVPFHSG
jgi:hypothetical protein